MSNRVTGAQLKSALAVSAPKQVAAAGAIVGKSVVTFTGKTAFAVWSARPKYSWDTSQHRSFRINYPSLSDEALLSRPEADLIAAYTLHETGHVSYSFNDMDAIGKILDSYIGHIVPRGGRLGKVHNLANGLEDGRMENSVIKAGIARNARSLFGRLLNKLTGEIDRTYNPCDFSSAAFTLALLAREALGNGNAYTASLLARIPEPKRTVYALAMEDVRNGPVGVDTDGWAYRVACMFYMRWQDAAEKTEGKRPDPLEPLDGDDVPEDGEDQAQPAPAMPEDVEEEDEDHGFGNLDGDEDDDFDDDEFDDEGGSPDEPDDAGPPDDLDDSPGFGSDEPAPDSGDDSIPDDGPAEDEPAAGGDDNNAAFDDNGDSDAPQRSSEPSIDDIIKRANKRTNGSLRSDLSGFSPCSWINADEQVNRLLGKTI